MVIELILEIFYALTQRKRYGNKRTIILILGFFIMLISFIFIFDPINKEKNEDNNKINTNDTYIIESTSK